MIILKSSILYLSDLSDFFRENPIVMHQPGFSVIHYFLPNPASIDGEEKNKKLPLLGIELTTSRPSVQCSTDCARQESVGKEISEVSFVSCTTSHFGLWTLDFISRINRA